jgi:hypothetical protein
MSLVLGFSATDTLLATTSLTATSMLLPFAPLLLGLAWVAFATYRNAQATASIAQVLYTTEQADELNARGKSL